jgi:rhamnose transport system substrate-binding protein
MKHIIHRLLLLVLTFTLTLTIGVDAREKQITIGVMPKLVGIDYFNAVEKGAKEAGKELGVKIVYDGPVSNDVTKQSAIVESWIARKFDAICIAPNDPDAIAPVLKKARKRGIAVLSYDADANPKARDYFVNQATYDDIAKALVETMAKGIGPEGKYIYLTGSLTAVNQNIWMERMEKYRARHYPKMKNLSKTPKVSEEDQALATQVTIDVLKTYPDLQGIYAMTSVALPGAAEALKKENTYKRVYLTGVSTPKGMKDFVMKGVVEKVVLWNPVDLGYLTVYAAKAVVEKKITDKTKSIQAGRLGEKKVSNHEIMLGDPLVFDKKNIEKYDF